MNQETKKILGTLEVLLESCPCINIPGHEDGGYIYPFVWETSKQGEFNPFNLGISKRWLKLTDNDIERTGFQGIEYTKSFISYSLSVEEERKKLEEIQELFKLLNNHLQRLETFDIRTGASDCISLIVGQTVEGDWISVCPTVYTESYIPQEQISRTFQKPALVIEGLGENTKGLISKIKKLTSKIGNIEVQSDIADYSMAYSYRMLYGTGKTKESAVEKVLQPSRILEISQFHSFYPDKQYFQEWELVDEPDKQELMYQKYTQINNFLNKTFSKVMMYRFSFWTLENIYIIGKTQSSDWVGIHIESDFVYNP